MGLCFNYANVNRHNDTPILKILILILCKIERRYSIKRLLNDFESRILYIYAISDINR